MMDKRMERREKLLGKNESKIAMGGGGMNIQPVAGAEQKHNVLNDPNIVGSFMKERSSLEDGGSTFLYGEKVPSANTIDPSKVERSTLQQNHPITTRGFNQKPFGASQVAMFDVSARSVDTDFTESERLAEYGKARNLPYNAMGLATPGALPASFEPNFDAGPGFMPTEGGMTPGATPQKIGQKKKGGKK